MVPKIRAPHRENIDRRQVRENSLGLLRGAERGWWDGAVQVRSIRRPFAPEVSPTRLCRHPRESVGKRAKPHDSAVFRHPPSVRYTCENLSAGLWGPAARDADAISTFSSPVYSPHPPKKDPTNREIHPRSRIEHPGCGYSFSILLIYSLISDSKSVNPISRTTTSQYPDRSFRKSRTREPRMVYPLEYGPLGISYLF